MVKRKAASIIKNVFKQVSSQPTPIAMISEKAEVNWETTKKCLELLKSLNIVEVEEKENKKLYFTRTPLPDYSDTLFGIPLKENDEKMINFLFMKIREIWLKRTNKFPGKVQMQKTLARVNYDCKLNLPIAWYLYGMTCVKVYRPEQDYESEIPDRSKEITENIEIVVERYSGFEDTTSLKNEQYKEFENKTYQIKQYILSLIYSDLDKTNFLTFCIKLSDLLKHFIKNDCDKETAMHLTEFISLVNVLNSQLKENKVKEYRNEIIDLFSNIWGLMAKDIFFRGLKEIGYSDLHLINLINDIKLHKQEVQEQLMRFAEIIPKINMVESEEIKKLQGSVKEEKEIDDYEKIAKESANSDLFGKFGIN